MKWRGDLLAWANDAGVKVHDMKTDRGIAFIERPKGIPRPEVLLPHLVWQVNNVLIEYIVYVNQVCDYGSVGTSQSSQQTKSTVRCKGNKIT
jgi:hypothetical protein